MKVPRTAKGIALSLLVILMTVPALAQDSQTAPAPVVDGGEAPCLRVGVYDSRAVALAYGRSYIIKADLRTAETEMAIAEAEGDEAKKKEIGDRMVALQKQLHEQVFSTGSIDNILKKIDSRIKKYAFDKGLDVIVNKWDTTFVAEGAEMVDITMDLVEMFKPDDTTREQALDIQTRKPVPMDQLDHDH